MLDCSGAIYLGSRGRTEGTSYPFHSYLQLVRGRIVFVGVKCQRWGHLKCINKLLILKNKPQPQPQCFYSRAVKGLIWEQSYGFLGEIGTERC